LAQKHDKVTCATKRVLTSTQTNTHHTDSQTGVKMKIIWRSHDAVCSRISL